MYIYKVFNLKERSIFLILIGFFRTHFNEWVFFMPCFKTIFKNYVKFF